MGLKHSSRSPLTFHFDSLLSTQGDTMYTVTKGRFYHITQTTLHPCVLFPTSFNGSPGLSLQRPAQRSDIIVRRRAPPSSAGSLKVRSSLSSRRRFGSAIYYLLLDYTIGGGHKDCTEEEEGREDEDGRIVVASRLNDSP